MLRRACFTVALGITSTLVPACDGGTMMMPPGPLGRPDPMHGTPSDGDIDGDGVPNDADVCPSLANADQTSRCDYAPPPTTTTDGLERLNFWRAQLGLDPVVEDPELTRTCGLHIDYLQQYAAANGLPAYLSHTEDLALPYASAEGDRAGRDSVLSYGTANGSAAVDGWLDTLYHRIPLLHPGLTRIGMVYDATYACLQYRPGTASSTDAPHPIFWPVADSPYTRPIFGGNESPCPTIDDPLGGGACPGSAAIATLGLYGGTSFSDVEATITRLDTGEVVPIGHVWHAGGPSPHEAMGYVEGTIALVPAEGFMYAAATYEVNVHATHDGVAENIRWRFAIGAIDQTLACDVFGPQGSFDRAVPVTQASILGRVCEASDFYRIRPDGTFRVTLQYDRNFGVLELVAYDAAQNEIGRSAEGDGTDAIDAIPGMSYLEVRGASAGAMGGYILVIE